jgi:hypothetical protein
LAGKSRRKDHSEDASTAGVNIKMDVREIRWEGLDWIHLAHYRDQQQVLLKMEINFHVP